MTTSTSMIYIKVTSTSFWLKCKNLPKCTKFCSTRKLVVAAKNLGLLTKNCLMHWQIWGLIRQYLCCILESLNSNFACGNGCTHVILLPIGPQQPLPLIIKWTWDLNLFPSFLKASTSNFRIFFVGSLVFNLWFKKFPNHRFFSDSAENPVNTHIWQIWIDLIHSPTLFLGKPRKIVNEVNLKFRFYAEKSELFPIKFVR